MTAKDLMTMVYDRLANNTQYEFFEPSMAEEMQLDGVNNEVEIVIDGKTYVLSIREEK